MKSTSHAVIVDNIVVEKTSKANALKKIKTLRKEGKRALLGLSITKNIGDKWNKAL